MPNKTVVHAVVRDIRAQWMLAAFLYAALFWRLLSVTFPDASPPFAPVPPSPPPAVSAAPRAPANVEWYSAPETFEEAGGELYSGADVAVATLILEAVGEGYEAMVAVGEVIRNRAAESGKKYGEVCLMPRQFSGWNDAARAREFLSRHRAYYETAFRAWLDSSSSNLTRGATHYHADYVHPYWADSMHCSAKIGRHIFYR
jgi:hypothetical protein